jgi:hypothetical protein
MGDPADDGEADEGRTGAGGNGGTAGHYQRDVG